MFITGLLTMTKTWQQPACPRKNEWKTIHIYNGILVIKNEIMPFAAT